jgi:hypothetical protein
MRNTKAAPLQAADRFLRCGTMNAFEDEDENDLRLALNQHFGRCRHTPIRPHLYSAATCAPFSATERFIKSTRKASATDTAAKIRKQSK